MFKYRIGFMLFVFFACAPLGCSANKQAPSRVSGRITYKGVVVKAGAVRFHTAEGNAYDAQFSLADGTYTATDLPEGEMVVTVETESISPQKKAEVGKDAEKRNKMLGSGQKPPKGREGTAPGEHYVKIPGKYADPKTSPLKVTLSSGGQTHNFELTD